GRPPVLALAVSPRPTGRPRRVGWPTLTAMSQPHESSDSRDGASAQVPRIRPGGFRELGPFGWAVNRIGARVIGARDVNLFATLGHARRLFPAWLAYSGMMMPFGVIDRKTTELVILRISHLRGSAYERAHHERIGGRVGLTTAEVERTTRDPATADWSDRRREILCAVDEIVATKDLGDETWDRLSAHLEPGE